MYKYLLAIVVLSFIALWPFVKPGMFTSHDGEWMIIRFSAFHQTLASGQIPVRFTERLNNNYGYPVLNFLYPLPFYLAEVPKLIGFNFTNSIKIVFALSTIGSAMAMFWALAQRFDKRAAFAGAIVYLFLPYRFVDLYVRGSLGESVAFAFVPLIFGCIFKVQKGNNFLPVLALSSALLVLSHNVIALLFLPTFLIYILLFAEKFKLKMIIAIIIGILTATFFWLPAIYDLQYVKLSQIKVSEIEHHLVSIQKLVFPSWGYGPSPNSTDGLSTQLGIVTIFIYVTTIVLLVVRKKRSPETIFLLSLILAVAYLQTSYSAFFWKSVPQADIIQFPWRLLALVVFATSVLTAAVIENIKSKTIATALISTAAILISIPHTFPKSFNNVADSLYSTNEDTTTVREEYMPLWVKEKKPQRANTRVLVENGELVTSEIKPGNYKIKTYSDKESNVHVNTIYFPGWHVEDSSGQKIVIDYDNPFGLINFRLPKGEHDVIIKYTRTPIQLASEIVSILALALIGVFTFHEWRKRNS